MKPMCGLAALLLRKTEYAHTVLTIPQQVNIFFLMVFLNFLSGSGFSFLFIITICNHPNIFSGVIEYRLELFVNG
jgi:hypothetical protein